MFPTGYSCKYASFAWIKVIQLAWLQTYIQNSKVIPSFANLRHAEFKKSFSFNPKGGVVNARDTSLQDFVSDPQK